jgi:hypothetical protein
MTIRGVVPDGMRFREPDPPCWTTAAMSNKKWALTRVEARTLRKLIDKIAQGVERYERPIPPSNDGESPGYYGWEELLSLYGNLERITDIERMTGDECVNIMDLAHRGELLNALRLYFRILDTCERP